MKILGKEMRKLKVWNRKLIIYLVYVYWTIVDSKTPVYSEVINWIENMNFFQYLLPPSSRALSQWTSRELEILIQYVPLIFWGTLKWEDMYVNPIYLKSSGNMNFGIKTRKYFFKCCNPTGKLLIKRVNFVKYKE